MSQTDLGRLWRATWAVVAGFAVMAAGRSASADQINIVSANGCCCETVRSCSGQTGTDTCTTPGTTNTCVVPQAANVDFCPKAACLGGVIDNTDTDGDGLLDFHKDLFVEVDYFDCTVAGGDCPAGDTHTHKPLATSLATITQAFANAPVSNPDGTTGVNHQGLRRAPGFLDSHTLTRPQVTAPALERRKGRGASVDARAQPFAGTPAAARAAAALVSPATS